MKKVVKKFIGLLSVAVFCFLSTIFVIPQTAVAQSATPIDMYLIAGQSNAVGYSAKGSLSETFENVGYAGAVDYYLSWGAYKSENIDNFSEFKWSVTAGLGRTSDFIGPEYGMAKYLNDKYTGGTKAFIFKSGAGGTSLGDNSAGDSANYGNWYPRSLWEDGYTPLANGSKDTTGVQYHLFVENFKSVYNELVANGYAPTVKGMVWMQGCNDLGSVTSYENLLKTFIADIRTDLTSITQDDLSAMPFIIGKIATTFASYNNPQVPAFNAMQQRVADSMAKVETIETSDLIIVNQDGSANGTDIYHFNTNDAVTLGQRFAKKLCEVGNLKYVDAKAQNGRVSYSFNGNTLTLTFIPNEDCRLSSLTIDGEEVAVENVVNNTYVIDNVEKEVVEVNAEFTSAFQNFTITYASLSGKGSYASAPRTIKEGNALVVTIVPMGQYAIQSVTFNDEEMECIGDNKYKIIPTQSGKVKVTFAQAGQSGGSAGENETPNENQEPQEEETGCGSVVSAGFGASMLALGALALLFKRKR